MERESKDRTPYAVICPTHEQVFLTYEEYMRQMGRPESRWTCPRCGAVSEWDDVNYDAMDPEAPVDEPPEPIGTCKCGAPIYSPVGFCGICGR